MAEADPRSSNFNSNYEFDKLVCDNCSEAFTLEKPAKLLPCLHSVCDTCVLSLTQIDEPKSNDEEKEKEKETDGATTDSEAVPVAEGSKPINLSKPECPLCKIDFSKDLLIKNPFLDFTRKGKIESDLQDGSPLEEKFSICTSCDENQKATSFCFECQEWLCDPCVVAHKRVKFTKDHTIRSNMTPGDEEDVSDSGLNKRQMFCNNHKTEPLKLFCLTCEALTCRDCQLNEHKDHKYQFIAETIDHQKQALTDGIKELQEKLAKNEELAEKMSTKEKDIKKQQLEVFTEVRQVANTITDELVGWCKQLMSFLQGVCHGRLRDLSHKKKEADVFAKKAKHTVAFVEAALKSGDDLSILHAKSLMSKSLAKLQVQNVNVQQSMFELEIKYENDASFLTKNVSKMGFINVNGKSYPQHSGNNDKPEKENPLKNLTRENFSQNIADLLNKQPVHVRETYKNYTQEQRKLFLQKLMLQTQQQQQQHQQQKLAQAQTQSRVAPFNSDAGAIRDLYGTNSTSSRQVNQVRPTGAYVPENPLLKQRHLMQQQNQQQLRAQAVNNFQAWRDGVADQPHRPTNASDPFWNKDTPSTSQSIMNLTRFCDTGPQGPQMPQIPRFPNGSQAGQSPSFAAAPPTASAASRMHLQNKFDIDPLNLKGKDPNAVQVKQEPRERDFGPACQFGEKRSPTYLPSSSPHMSLSPRLQSPPTNSQTPPMNSQTPPNHTPSHTPSPSQVDGGTRSTSSPALPDPAVMDRDRNELMKGLVNPTGQKFSSYHLHPKHDPSDPSEDYCGVCHNGGDLLCCDRCPKVFHLQCHVPPISSNLSSSEVWTCSMCVSDEELVINNPVFKEYEITSTGKRKAPSGLTDKEMRVCERILLELFCLETSTLFHEPVPKSVPSYYKVITQPMDFSTIKIKLRRGHFNHYESIEDFISDCKLVFKNCYKFNAPISDIYSVGKSVEGCFESLIQHYLPCYMDHLLRKTPSPVFFDPNVGDAARNKKRRSPGPDTNPEAPPVHYS